MHLHINGTEIRSNDKGIVATRGKRELHLLGTSVAQIDRSKGLLAHISFNKLFNAAKTAPAVGRNVRYIKISNR